MLLTQLWTDERGFVISSELVLLGTLGILGATAGLHVAATAIDEELFEVAGAFRSLDQSYCVAGFSRGGAVTAGSAFIQQDVETSLADLRAIKTRHEEAERGAAEDRPPRARTDRARPNRRDERRPGIRPDRREERRPDRPRNRRAPRRERDPILDAEPQRL